MRTNLMPKPVRWLTIISGVLWGAFLCDADSLRADPPTAKSKVADLSQVIDQSILKILKEKDIPVSPVASDAEFLRRVYLDLVGVIPSATEARSFLKSNDSNKRARLIVKLLADRRFGKFLGTTWTKMALPHTSGNGRLNSGRLQSWFASKFNANTPMDQLAYDFITASKSGATTFYVANTSVDKVVDKTSEMFLGVKLQCAQCHDHPFVNWKRKEYWAMARFFTKIRYSRSIKVAKKYGYKVAIDERDVELKPGQGNRRRRTYILVPPQAVRVKHKFLQGEEPELEKAKPYRPVLAKWITSKDNKFFARAMVNRVWFQLFGRGLVNPVNDMHEGNAPTHPQLLQKLTEQFKASNFDLKNLYRAICNSETYQRSSKTKGKNVKDSKLYSHALVRDMTPEQLFDSLHQVMGKPLNPKVKARRRKSRKREPSLRARFINFFSVDNANPLKYQSGIPQALKLMNAREFNNTDEVLSKAMRIGQNVQGVLDHLYLTVLARFPTAEESERLSKYITNQTTPRQGFSDVLWVLLNSSEFALNH